MATTEKPIIGRYDPAAVIEPPKSPVERFMPLGLFVLLTLLFVPAWGIDNDLFLWLRALAYGAALVALAVPSLRGPLKGYLMAVLAVAIIDAHVYGWKVVDINPGLLANKAGDMRRVLGQIIQPDLITHDQFRIEIPVGIAGVEQADPNAKPIQLSQEVVPVKLDTQRQPSSITDTVSYNPSITAAPGTVAPGQKITLSGAGLRPDASGQILWQSTGQSASTQDLGAFKTDGKGNFTAAVVVPTDMDRVVNISGFPNTLVVRQTYDVGGAKISPTVDVMFNAIILTILTAMWATSVAIFIGLPLSFFAAQNMMSRNLFSRTVYIVARTILNVLRSIEVLIWGLIFVAAVGIGPFTGMLALMVHSVASLGKLYSEAIESIDPGPMEAITATGANRLQVIVYAVIPQFIPQFISFTLYRWDVNVRMATVIGLVGGGGIGLLLTQYINQLAYEQAGTAILFIALAVIIMDYASAKIRAAII